LKGRFEVYPNYKRTPALSLCLSFHRIDVGGCVIQKLCKSAGKYGAPVFTLYCIGIALQGATRAILISLGRRRRTQQHGERREGEEDGDEWRTEEDKFDKPVRSALEVSDGR